MTPNPSSLCRRDLLQWLGLTAAATAAWRSPLAAAAAARETGSPAAPAHLHPADQPQLRSGTEQIAILVYPEFTALDALGPHYALAGMMGATVRFVAKTLDPVPSEGAAKGGFQVKPHLSFADCPEHLDLLLVPAG